jgi:hypothetical protein
MNRQEFEHLRNLPDKQIIADIVFIPSKYVSTTLILDRIPVLNSSGLELFLNASYIPDIPSLKFNFHVTGIGAICRLEVNGKVHKPAGRTHKHSVKTDSCVRTHLPSPDARPDLDLNTQTVKQIWDILCREANIVHIGEFVEP